MRANLGDALLARHGGNAMRELVEVFLRPNEMVILG